MITPPFFNPVLEMFFSSNNDDLDASAKMSRKIWRLIFESPWYSLIASSISFNFIWGLHTVSTD